MGSRLYEDIDACANTAGVTEVWVSFSDCAQRRLTTNFIGQSDNNIYTLPNAVVDEILSFNIYKSFLQELETLETDGRIAEYALFPYDWRRGLDVIVTSQQDISDKIRAGVGQLRFSYLYQMAQGLAFAAPSGKVTIVAHSNGGLVAKYFLATLAANNDPLLKSIDNLILVGVPQVGTPDAILGALHGADLGGGLVMTNETSRLLLNNFPLAYHLLPHGAYFSQVSTPVVTFEEGTATDAWRATYGPSISSMTGLHAFLGAGSGRIAPAVDDLDTPEVLHDELLGYARTMSILSDEWTIPSTLTVSQIAGTGLRTPATLTYASGEACTARTLGVCTERSPVPLLRANFVYDGDGTVVTPSALALPESDRVERWWVDLESYNSDSHISRVHKDIFEVEDVISFIRNTALHISSPYTHLFNSAPTITQDERLNFTLHSPLYATIQSGTGVISSSTNSIEGASYHRYGETTFISIPKGTPNPVLTLDAYKEGSFTLDVEEEQGGEVMRRTTYSAIPTRIDTQATLSLVPDDVPRSTIFVDYEGDGTVDLTYATTGPVTVADAVTYEDVYSAIYALNLKKAYEKVLITFTQKAEKSRQTFIDTGKHHKLEVFHLTLLKKYLFLLSKIRIITPAQYEDLKKMIDELLE